MFDSTLDAVISEDLIAPIMGEIDELETKGCYKEANQYLRVIIKELNLLRMARVSLCTRLEESDDPWRRFRQIEKQITRELTSMKQSSPLMYLESLRRIMETLSQASSSRLSFNELQALNTLLCQTQLFRLEEEAEQFEQRWASLNQAILQNVFLH
jgi:hypothetical protein